jgi:predicted alpha-1,6-mannanase (GH76 family)
MKLRENLLSFSDRLRHPWRKSRDVPSAAFRIEPVMVAITARRRQPGETSSGIARKPNAVWLILWLSIVIPLLGSFHTASAAPRNERREYAREAREGIRSLQHWYMPTSGLYAAPAGWWNSANSTTVLANYARVTGDDSWNSVIANTFTAAQRTRRGFINDYFDDDSWWALAWIDAYDLTHKSNYLSMAESIFARLAGDGWDTAACGGGMWWSSAKHYKNAIANELFLSVAVELANRTQGKRSADYLDWAAREWNWLRTSGMINSENLINDGLDSTNPGACVNNGKNPWTYNQGVILGGLVGLSRAEHNPALLEQATAIADSAIAHLTSPDGILKEITVHGGDSPQFKGIFVRNLMDLYHALPDADPHRQRYRNFVDANASSIWARDQGKRHEFGAVWQGPFDSADATRQTSALDALIAAASMQ